MDSCGVDLATPDLIVAQLHRCSCPQIVNDTEATPANVFIECSAFPITHTFPIQVVYMFMFSFLVLASVGGNLTVAW